jgi:RNase P subunit RPR2
VLLRALLLFLFFAFLARAVWRLLEGVARGAMGPGQEPSRRAGPQAPSAVKMTQCPECGTYVVPGKAVSEVVRGQVRYFCSETCRAKQAG